MISSMISFTILALSAQLIQASPLLTEALRGGRHLLTEECTFQGKAYADGDAILDAAGNTCTCIAGKIDQCKCRNADGSFAMPTQYRMGNNKACRCMQVGSADTLVTIKDDCVPFETSVGDVGKRAPMVASDFTRNFEGNNPAFPQVWLAGSSLMAYLYDYGTIWGEFPPCWGRPHSHPYGTEYTLTLKGKSLVIAFVDQSVNPLLNKPYVYKTTTMGPSVTTIPAGLPHFVFNPSCELVEGFAIVDSGDPGLQWLYNACPASAPEPIGGTIIDPVAWLIWENCQLVQECKARCGLE